MYIRELTITNYKNIKNVKIDLQHEYSMIYLTGENGIGKSNIIDIIFKLFTYKKNLFEKEDFYKNEEKIEIEIKLELKTNEIFKDYLYRDNNKYFMKVVYKQYSSNDEYEWFYKNPTEEYKLLNNILTNFICYKYSPREFDNNFMFNKSNRIGKFISKIIENQIKKYQNDDNKLQKLLKENYENCKNELNEIFKPIFNKPNQELKLNIEIDDEIKFLLKLFELVHYHSDDNKLYLNQLGRGYYLYPFIDFLAFLYDKINNTKSQGFNTNIIILFDEPEVFLSPFLQRQFMDHWLSIFNDNQDCKIINNILNIITDDNDEIDYKITPIFFVSTHSAHIIPHLELNEKNNRLSIQRLYYDKENTVKVASLDEEEANLKQFMIFDRNILEGLFAKKIILVEGDTEVGFLPSCLNANGINIHQEHIYIIKASPNNFPNLAQIFSKLQIKTYILTDRDCKNKYIEEIRNKKIYITYTNKEYGYVDKRVYDLYETIKNCDCNNVKIFVSDYWDFEESILVCIKNNFQETYTSIGKSYSDDENKLIKKIQDENLEDEEFSKKLLYMRENNKNIDDNYKLIQKIIKENLKLEQDEYKNGEKIDFGNMNREVIKNAAEENYKLPKYIIDLIEKLKNDE